jgi:hypothetical protein
MWLTQISRVWVWVSAGFALDVCIVKLQEGRQRLYEDANVGVGLLIWVSYSTALATVAVLITHYISPHAIGSGIPEMKVILKGTNLSRYLSMRTLVAKILGLVLALGSGECVPLSHRPALRQLHFLRAGRYCSLTPEYRITCRTAHWEGRTVCPHLEHNCRAIDGVSLVGAFRAVCSVRLGVHTDACVVCGFTVLLLRSKSSC